MEHQTITLRMGKHTSPAEGACVMELASMLAGEEFTDEPSSVCPVIRDLLRCYNDRVDDEGRQALHECAAAVVGSRSTPCVEHERLRLCAEAARSVRWRWSSWPTFPLFPRERHAAQRAGWALATGHGAEPRLVLALVMDLLDVGARPQPTDATEQAPSLGAAASPVARTHG